MRIDNPDFFEDANPHVLPVINAVGIDIWTVQGGVLFDNIIIGEDTALARAFSDATFKEWMCNLEWMCPLPESDFHFSRLSLRTSWYSLSELLPVIAL